MRKTRRKKKRSSKTAKRQKARRRKLAFITRAAARRRAERHVLNRMFKGATVRDGAQVRLGIYFRGGWTANDV